MTSLHHLLIHGGATAALPGGDFTFCYQHMELHLLPSDYFFTWTVYLELDLGVSTTDPAHVVDKETFLIHHHLVAGKPWT